MFSWLFAAAMIAAHPAPYTCQGQGTERWTLVSCRAHHVGTWSVESYLDDTEDLRGTAFTVQSLGRCGWFQRPNDPDSDPQRQCPAVGTVRHCVIRATAARCAH